MSIASTQRLILRRFYEADVDAMIEVFGDPDVMRFGDGPQSPKWIRYWIGQRVEDYEQQGFGLWAVVLRNSASPIGYCGLTRYDDINGKPEIELGYRLAKKYWGRGIATEAAKAVRDMAFLELGITRIISLIDPGNARSIRVAEKLGMVYTDDVVMPGYSHPDRIYACTYDVG